MISNNIVTTIYRVRRIRGSGTNPEPVKRDVDHSHDKRIDSVLAEIQSAG